MHTGEGKPSPNYMLRAQITTQDLLDLHPDLERLFFASEAWQHGDDGVIVGDTLPATFTAESATFTDTDGRNTTAQGQILNVPERGFFRVSTVHSGTACTINVVSIAHQRTINQLSKQLDGWVESDLTSVRVQPGAHLRWSVGGWESQIAHAFRALAGDLVASQVPLSYIYDTEATYVDALVYRSLCNVFTALTKESGDNNEKMAMMYYQRYRGMLEKLRNLYLETSTALVPDDFERNG